MEFIKAAIDGAHNATLNLAGVKSDDEFWTKAKNQFTTFENTLRSSVTDLDTEVICNKNDCIFKLIDSLVGNNWKY